MTGLSTYVGDVGTGFTHHEIERLWRMLEPLSTDRPPLQDVPPALARRVHWVEPRLAVQVRYTEMTDEGRLRHPAYLGRAGGQESSGYWSEGET